MRMLRRVGMWAAAGGSDAGSGKCRMGPGNRLWRGHWKRHWTDTGAGAGTGGGGGGTAWELDWPVGSAGAVLAGGTGSDNIPTIPLSPDMEANQAKMRNIDRQKQLVEDTQKLLALANELKADVDKSTKDTLSLDVVKKADEIEKLAHSVKEKMKNAT
jgi:hypothetical protein